MERWIWYVLKNLLAWVFANTEGSYFVCIAKWEPEPVQRFLFFYCCRQSIRENLLRR